MKKLVIYSCVTGSYDKIERPSVQVPWADWVCFSTEELNDELWQFRRISTNSSLGPILQSRQYKLNPHLYFPEYEYSLWIDGNIGLSSEEIFHIIEAKMSEGVLYSGIHHPERDDVYEESLRILMGRREKASSLRKTVRFLKKEGFPEHWGLMENNVILRKHNDPEIIRFDELWWSMLKRYSHRDQMSQSYCLWKCGITPDYLLPEGYSARNHPAFTYRMHGPVYVKGKSLKARYQDAVAALRVFLYRVFLNSL
ncbi:MAG: DUF616 domain-containing protein [Rikenellaceae bacterium]|nr:DUF616 domain-containing protein [Rikenellaceae bacterium]